MRSLLLAAVFLYLSALSGCQSLNPLDMMRKEKNAHPPAELKPVNNSISPRVLWSANIGGGTDEKLLKLAPAIQEGRVYLANARGDVVARDAHNGRIIWSAKTDTHASGGPGVGEGLVLLGTRDAEVVALDAATGKQRWRSQVSSEVLSVPKADLGMVVVHTLDGKLTALEAATGAKRWVYDNPVPVLSLRGNSSPVIVGNAVICGFANGKLASLDLISGKLLWEATVGVSHGRSELDQMIDIDADPLVIDQAVFVATYQGDLAAILHENGRVAWRHKLSSYAGIGGNWRQIYVTDAMDYVWSFDPSTATAMWKQTSLQYRQLTAPVTIGDYIVVGDYQGFLHWMKFEDGSIVARTRVGNSPITAAPKVVDNVLYVYGDGGDFAAIKVN